MKIFLKFKSKNSEIDLKNHEIIEYEYRSCRNLWDEQFYVKIILDVEFLNEDIINYIVGWSNENYESENFYKTIFFGIIFDENIVKEITFYDAYILYFARYREYSKNNERIFLTLKQKEDKFESINIFPKIMPKLTNLDDFQNKNLEYDDVLNNLDTVTLEEDFQTQNVKLFKEKLSKQKGMIKEYEDLLIKKFSCASETAQNIFLKYVPDNSVVFTKFKDGEIANYSWDEELIFLSIEQDLENPKKQGIYYFHEHGHLIDLSQINKTGIDKGIISNDALFGQLLEDDFCFYIKNYQKEHNVDIHQAYDDTIALFSDNKYSFVSDLYGGITRGECQGKYGGHPIQYWQEMPDAVEQEAVAHFFELQFDSERLEMGKKFFPDSIKRFEVLLKELDKSY